MSEQANHNSMWDIRKNPAIMSRSVDFPSYTETRQFLDQLAELSESTGYYPNLNFNRTQVTISIYSEEDQLGETELKFAKATDALLTDSGQE